VLLNPLKALFRRAGRPAGEDNAAAGAEMAVRGLTGCLPISEAREEDVFLAGYPKSGNTWVQNLVAGVAFGADPQYAHDTLVQDLVPDVHYKRFYKRYGSQAFFKSHHLPRPDYRRVIYLLRDGRDVMVSYLHYLEAQSGQKVDFLRLVKTGEGLYPCKWHEHVGAWLDNPYRAEMIVVRYEDLKRAPVAELQRICALAGLTRDTAFLERVVAGASFERMRQKEAQAGWDDPNWPRDKAFVRRGAVGSHKDEMPADVLEAFLGEARDALARCEYA
jgi:hypothetical protein